jgi:HPt (histidine-containing phosphotransfer) domain-containing protein
MAGMGGDGGGRAAAGTSSPPRIDRAVLSELTAAVGPDAVADVCDLFAAEARARVDALRAACASGDADAAAQSAHRLKSACGFVGAARVAHLCAEIEGHARARRLDELAAWVEALSDEIERAAHELAAALDQPRAGA